MGAGALAAVGLIAIAGTALYVLAAIQSAPSLASVQPLVVGTPSEVLAADGSRLGFIQSDALRTPITWSQVPASLKRATVAIEDQRFYHNDGVDPTAILRAALADITHGETLQGASTITMQLVRNLYLGNDLRTFKQKLTEAKLAVEYNRHHSKLEILTNYLNDVDYGTVGGQTLIGVEAGSQVFFSKPVWQLDLQQAALLAGLPQAPSEYNPLKRPALARERRNVVLAKMAQLNYISAAEARKAERAPLELHRGDYYAQQQQGFFFEYVRQQLLERYGAHTVDYGGLKVYTTLDLNKQRQARQAIEEVLPEPGDPAAAIVSIDPRTGYIRAMAEAPQYESSQFNLAADAHRQAGSTFKTFVLLTALRQGVNPYTTYYTSRPLDFVDPRWGPIDIRSYSGTLGANYNVEQAFMQSNDPIFQLLDLDVGPPNVKQTAQLAGITAPLEGIPAEGLGGLRVGVTPLEMADAYATIADGGWRDQPIAVTKVVFPDGRVEELGTPRRTKVFSDGVTAEATKLLEQYITQGLGTGANYGCSNSGGKTGTVDNNTDAWFVGFTNHISTAVWIGYPRAKIPMTDVQGVTVQGPNLPATLWHDYMQAAVGGECPPFPPATQPLVYQPFFGKYASSGSVKGESHGVSPFGEEHGAGEAPRYHPPQTGAPLESTPAQPEEGNGRPHGGFGSREAEPGTATPPREERGAPEAAPGAGGGPEGGAGAGAGREGGAGEGAGAEGGASPGRRGEGGAVNGKEGAAG
jgi:penicillin-binding protein 1A